MITDVFFRRYQDVPLWTAYKEDMRRFLNQAAQIVTKEILGRNETRYKERANDTGIQGLKRVHELMERELGVGELVPRYWFRDVSFNGVTRKDAVAHMEEMRTVTYITMAPAQNADIDRFIKERVSFVELAFQHRLRQLVAERLSTEFLMRPAGGQSVAQAFDAIGPGHAMWSTKVRYSNDLKIFEAAIEELNGRLRMARMPLTYHNHIMQISDDSLIEENVERPFWSIVANPKWAVVDQQMKEAIDGRDRGDRNAVSNALNALESAIKTISKTMGWSTGNEKGAANFIDNLVKKRDGARFIEVWEKDMLIDLFRDVRNMFGHGPAGDESLPTLRPEQTVWALDACMIWIKTLVRRA